MVLSLNAEANKMKPVLRRINDQLRTRTIHDIPIDFSFGFSTFSPDDRISVEELIKSADAEMYEQKLHKKATQSLTAKRLDRLQQ